MFKVLDFSEEGPVSGLDFSADQTFFFVGKNQSRAEANSLLLFRVSSHEFSSPDLVLSRPPIFSIKAFNLSHRVAFSDEEGVKIWNWKSNRLESFLLNGENISNIDISNDDKYILSSGMETRVWEISDQSISWQLMDYNAFELTESIDVSQFSREFTYRQFDSSIFSYVNQPAFGVFVNGNSFIIGGINSGKLHIGNSTNLDWSSEIEGGPLQIYSGAIGCNNSILAIASKLPRGTFVWNLHSKQRVFCERFNEEYEGITSIAVHPSKPIIALGSLVGFVSVRNLLLDHYLFLEKIHEGPTRILNFSPNGDLLASGGEDGRVVVLRVQN
jgi:WD40 repeat protein